MEKDPSRKRSMIFLLAVLLCATVYYFFIAQGSPTMMFSRENRTFSFSGAKNTSVSFSFDTLTELSLYAGDTPDWGHAINGGQVLGGTHYGTWTNAAAGDYQAFVSDKVHHYILVRDAQKTALFNTANDETTDSLFAQMNAFRSGELN